MCACVHAWPCLHACVHAWPCMRACVCVCLGNGMERANCVYHLMPEGLYVCEKELYFLDWASGMFAHVCVCMHKMAPSHTAHITRV